LVNEGFIFEINLFIVFAICEENEIPSHIICSIILHILYSVSFSISLVLTLETKFAINDLYKIRTQNYFQYSLVLGVFMGIFGFIFVNVWN
jgi:hypothetical protein